jgi:hypothetical protein
MSLARCLKVVSKLGLSALALGIVAAATNAVTIYQGKFTLPFEVNWAGSTLPAGDYRFELESQGSPYTLYIHGQKTNAIIRAVSGDTGTLSTRAQFDVVDISGVHAIKAFEAPELGITFTYFIPKQKNTAPKEVHHNGTPQTDPASQVSARKMSIAVQLSGR